MPSPVIRTVFAPTCSVSPSTHAACATGPDGKLSTHTPIQLAGTIP